MVGKTDFTTEEWAKLIEGAMLAGIAVTAAEPSGLWGTLQEGFANARGLAGARDSSTSLVKNIVAELATSEGRGIAQDGVRRRMSGGKAADIAARSVAALGEVAQIVDQKAGVDAQPFKAWLYAIAERVADASTEGGFLGFGGEKVSEHEKATLADLAKALNI